MADATPQLKRKRESAIGSQKKSKKQRKSEAKAEADEAEAVNVATLVAEPATPADATPTAREKSKSNSRKSQTNGVQEDAPASTLSKSEGNNDKVQGKPTQSAPSGKDSKNASDKKGKDKQTEVKDVVKLQAPDSGKLQASGHEKTKKHKNKKSNKWTVSPAQGGWFLPTDPLFSLDEKYLVLANPKSLQVYYTETSLLARALPVGGTGFITAYALSSVKSNQVYVADSNGLITLWDWVDGTKIGRWDIGATVKNMAVVTQPGSDEDLVYCHETGSSHIVNVHALRTNSHASKTELKRVLKTSSFITSIQVLLQGKYVIIASNDSITIGKRLKVSKTAVQDFEYVWRELKFSKRVTTCNAYFRKREVSETGKKSAYEQRDIIDLVVGDEVGVILLFEDLLASFATLESSQKGDKSRSDEADSLRPKRLHWHRNAVGSVKWSLDGNYLVSGGDETVLTIWQLATGKPQHLPHLSAAIEAIVVSPSGSSYALSLANNSVIVISTTELDAKTNIVGIQTRRVDPDQLPKSTKPGRSPLYALQPVPIAVDPRNTQHVLFTVPSSQPRQRNEASRAEPYLQTFDIANERPVNRQALTRNNATDPNMGPEGRRIIEPSVKFLQISHDGEWLATVDEWLPPRSDMTHLNEGDAELSEEERLLRREVYLKIWRRDEKNGQWALETRIDAPHTIDDGCANGKVLDLVADPKSHGFATIGEDQVVRIWRPKTRLRDGIVVRGVGDRGLVNWSLHRSIELPKSDELGLQDLSTDLQYSRNARLAFSSDGSVIAAAISGTSETDHGLVHLIDIDNATIRRSMTEIDVNVLCGLSMIDRYLVIVTDCITVWDLVYDDIVYCISINTPGIDRIERTSVVRLVANQQDCTFAVSLPQFEKNDASSSKTKKASSKISIYSTEQKEPLWSYSVPGISLGLASRKGKGEKGFIVLDSVSCIRTINPTASLLTLPTHRAGEQAGVESIEDNGIEEIEDGDTAIRAEEDIVLDEEYDKPVVTQQDLEGIFHNESAPQAPKDVFSAVLRLFGGLAKAAA